MTTSRWKRRRVAMASILGALVALVHRVADARPACEPDTSRALSAETVQRFLDSTETISKTFFDARYFEKAGGWGWRFTPPLPVTLRQVWMTEPRVMTLAAMKISVRAQTVTVLLLQADGSVLPLAGGKLELLVCR